MSVVFGMVSPANKGNILSSFLFILIAVMLTVCALVIGANNGQAVVIDYFISSTSLTLSLLMALCFTLGAVLSSIIWGLFSLRLKLKLANSESQRKKLINKTVE